MKILTVENTTYDLDTVPDEIDDIRYCVLDAKDKFEIDYYFLPLIFLESFHAPAICLKIGEHSINMPMDWSILICDYDLTDVEIVSLTSLNNRGFLSVVTNPLTGKSIDACDIEITNIFSDVKWYFPKLKHGNILVVPLEDKENPRCAFFVKEVNKICDLDISDIL